MAETAHASGQQVREAAVFRHDVFHYRGDEQFTRIVGAFIREGLADDDAVAVAETPYRIGLLRDTLGDDAHAVDFLDLTTLGNPARYIPFWDGYIAARHGVGRRVRGVGEPAWPGRGAVEMTEVRLHEFLVNRAFDAGPGLHLLCPYDAACPPDRCPFGFSAHPSRRSQ
jgi:hypothetical protein